MVSWNTYRRQYVNPAGYRKDSPGVWVNENGREFHPFTYDGARKKQQWQVLAEEGLGPDDVNGTDPALDRELAAVLYKAIELVPLETLVRAVCPYCECVNVLQVYERGVPVGGDGRECQWCGDVVQSGEWEEVGE